MVHLGRACRLLYIRIALRRTMVPEHMYKNGRITMAWIVTGYQHSKRALQASSSANSVQRGPKQLENE